MPRLRSRSRGRLAQGCFGKDRESGQRGVCHRALPSRIPRSRRPDDRYDGANLLSRVTSRKFGGSTSGWRGGGVGLSVMIDILAQAGTGEGEAADQPARCRYARCLHAVEQ
jgi:hypothetical protein